MTDTKVAPDLDRVGGEVFWPGSGQYEQARQLFNGMFDRRPAVVVRCSSSDDVRAGLAYARSNDLEVTVYGGGHAVTGTAVADGAVCIDMRGMKTIEIDTAAQTAVVGAGCTWGEVDAATQAHGLAVTGGRVSTTGVVGLALGSGSGWLERSLGYTCDNLLSAELVTAEGQVVNASANENAELFWGLRGGSGNFGVITRLTLQLHRVGPLLLAGMLMFPAARAAELLRTWRDFMAEAPNEVGSAFVFVTAPPVDFVPEELRQQPVAAIILCYNGPVEEGQRVLAPLVELTSSGGVNLVQPMPYVAVQQMIDAGNQKGMRNYWTADFYGDLPDEAVDALAEVAARPVSPLSQVVLVAGGGAVAQVSDEASAFGNRDAAFNIHYLSMWPSADQDTQNISHTRRLSDLMRPWSTGGVYLNFIGDEGQSRVRSAFPGDKWQRLTRLKATWDPDNVFRHNQNIPPAAVGSQGS